MKQKKKLKKFLKKATQLLNKQSQTRDLSKAMSLDQTLSSQEKPFSATEQRLYKSLKIYFDLREDDKELSQKKLSKLKRTAQKIRHLEKELHDFKAIE